MRHSRRLLAAVLAAALFLAQGFSAQAFPSDPGIPPQFPSSGELE